MFRRRRPDSETRGGSNTLTAGPSQIATEILHEWTIVQIKSALEKRGYPVSGLKAELIERLGSATRMPSDSLLAEAHSEMKRRKSRPGIEIVLDELNLTWWLRGR